ADDGIEMTTNPEAVQVVHHPLPCGARCDGGLQRELARGDQVVDDSWQKLLQGGGLLVVEDLERLEFRLVEFRTGFLGQVDHGIEGPGRGANDREPPAEGQLLAMLAIDPLPGPKNRELRVHDQAIEVENQRLYGGHYRLC